MRCPCCREAAAWFDRYVCMSAYVYRHIPYDRCKLVSYCSPTCQKAHWRTHKQACAKGQENVGGNTHGEAKGQSKNDGQAQAELAGKCAQTFLAARRAQKRAELEDLIQQVPSLFLSPCPPPSLHLGVVLQNQFAAAAFGMSCKVMKPDCNAPVWKGSLICSYPLPHSCLIHVLLFLR